MKANLTLCPYKNENNTNCITIPRIQLRESGSAKITCTIHKKSHSHNFEISNYLLKNGDTISQRFFCSNCTKQLRENHFFFYCNNDECKNFYCASCKNKYPHDHQLSKRSFSNFWNKCIMHCNSYINYCKTCFISFCENCNKDEHKNHEIVDINIKNEKEINEIKNNLQIQVNYFEKVKKIMCECLVKMENILKLKKQILDNYNENKMNGNSIENLNEISMPLNQSYKQKIDDLTRSNNFKDKLLALDYFYKMFSPQIDNNDNIYNNSYNNYKYNIPSSVDSRDVSNNHNKTHINQEFSPKVINHENNHCQLECYKNKEEKSESKSNGDDIGIQKLNVLNEEKVIKCMIRLSSGNLALGLSNGLIKIYDANSICSIDRKNDDKEGKIDSLLTIDDFKGKRINYLYELKDKTLLCATYSKIYHIKLTKNDKDFEYIGTIDLSKRELPKKMIELGKDIIVSLGEKEYKTENIKRKKCLLKVFNRKSISKNDDNSFCLLKDNDSINSDSSFEEYLSIFSSDEEDSFKSTEINDNKMKNDPNFNLYINTDKILYFCSIFPIELNEGEKNEYIYEFIATSNKKFFGGENCVKIYGIYDNPLSHKFSFFYEKSLDNISCSRMVDSICKINKTYIGIGLQQYLMDCDDAIALFNCRKKEIEKTITGLSIGLLKKSINNNNYIVFTTNGTKDLKINNELRLFNIKNDKNNERLSKDKDKLIFSIKSSFSCLVELIPSDNNIRKNMCCVASNGNKFYIILFNITE